MKEKHRRGAVEDALRMLDLFASVGVRFFDITFTNIKEDENGRQELRGFRENQSLQQVRASLPPLMARAPERQNNIILRPRQPSSVFLIQLDDLETTTLERVRPVSFLIVTTSPGNHQAWLAVDAAGLTDLKDFKRRVIKATGADPTASGASRTAGTYNFKRKYGPDFPVVAIASAQAGLTVTPAELERLGLVAAPEPVRTMPPRVSRQGRAGKWPSYEECVRRAPPARSHEGPDISLADFSWSMIAIDWGFSLEDTADRLMEQSSKARQNGRAYADETARKAAAAVRRNRGHVAEPSL